MFYEGGRRKVTIRQGGNMTDINIEINTGGFDEMFSNSNGRYR